MTEEDIVKRALGNQTRFNLKKIRYIDTATLLDEVKMLYPAAAHIFVVNLDKRDVDGSPYMTVHKIRGVTIRTIVTKNMNGATHTKSTGSWQNVLAIVEGNLASLKVMHESMGEESYG